MDITFSGTLFDNVKVLMDKNRENYDLKEKIKLLEETSSELNIENLKNVKDLEEAEIKIGKLKSTIVSDNKESERIIGNLRAENHSLQIEIKNILKCDECEMTFDEKELLKQHNVSKHLPEEAVEFKCNECEQKFYKKKITRHICLLYIHKIITCKLSPRRKNK